MSQVIKFGLSVVFSLVLISDCFSQVLTCITLPGHFALAASLFLQIGGKTGALSSSPIIGEPKVRDSPLRFDRFLFLVSLNRSVVRCCFWLLDGSRVPSSPLRRVPWFRFLFREFSLLCDLGRFVHVSCLSVPENFVIPWNPSALKVIQRLGGVHKMWKFQSMFFFRVLLPPVFERVMVSSVSIESPWSSKEMSVSVSIV